MSAALEVGVWTPCDDFDYDSVSMQQSSVVDSDYVEKKVWDYELRKALASGAEKADMAQINLHLQVVSKTAVSANTPENSTKERISLRQLKIIPILIALLLTLAATGVVFLISRQSDESKNESSEVTTLITSTSKPLHMIRKTVWDDRISIKPKRPEIENSKLLIIMDTQSESCYNEDDCIALIKRRREATPGRTVHENFLIASDGTVFEGWGYFTGEHTYDKQQTSYNNGAFGIAFIGNYSSSPLESEQINALKAFVQDGIRSKRIDYNFNLYHQSQLTLNQIFSKTLLFNAVQTWDHWKTSKVDCATKISAVINYFNHFQPQQ